MNKPICPICHESMEIVNICVTLCNHMFHTGCLLRCMNNHICPICRKNIITGSENKTSKIPSGTYTAAQYLEQIKKHNIPIDELSPEIQELLEDYDPNEKTAEQIKKENEENDECLTKKYDEYKKRLKKADPEKYELFHGK